MLVHFSKYHGTGNDFIMIDGRDLDSSIFPAALISQLCDRRFGIGADGLIILKRSKQFDFTMQYFNADGREGTMCGNGGRCITAFAMRLGIIERATGFESIDGIHTASILPDNEVELKLLDVSGIEQLEDGFLLNTGSPHFVKFVTGLDEIDVACEGAEIRHQLRFGKEGVNVNFAEPGPEEGMLSVRTFERGVEDETWSCGTGVVASALSAHVHLDSDIHSYRIKTRGGRLKVSFMAHKNKLFTRVFLTGPASHVYDGTIDIIG